MTYLLVGIISALAIIILLLIVRPFRKRSVECMHMWGEVKDGWQYCNRCGFAKNAECTHNWEVEQKSTITNTGSDGDVRNIGDEIIYICKDCTQRKYVRTSIDDDPVIKML